VFSHLTRSDQGGAYSVVKFVGLRIVEVRLSGPSPQLVVQPAVVVTSGVIPAAADETGRGDFIYSPPRLIE
jgi:hypothetical protein